MKIDKFFQGNFANCFTTKTAPFDKENVILLMKIN